MKTAVKRTWAKPTVEVEQTSMEVTSYASAELPRRQDGGSTKPG